MARKLLNVDESGRSKEPNGPFKVGGIVEPPYFVGREIELKKLASDIESVAQNYLILAPRRYGKSSLLHNLKRCVQDKSQLLVPNVNCLELTSYSDFYKVLMATLLGEYERKAKLKGLWAKFTSVFKEKPLAALRHVEEIGGSIADIGTLYLKFRESELDEKELASAAFRFFGSFAKENKLSIVFLLDEFQEIAAFDGHLFKLFKEAMDRHPHVRYFFSGSSVELLSEIFLMPKSPLYLMTAKHFMEPLQKREVIQFVAKRLKDCDITISSAAAELLYDLTGGIPFYVQKLGLIAFQEARFHEYGQLSSEIIRQAFSSMLDELEGEFEVRWLSRFSVLQRKIVKALAVVGEAHLTEVAHQVSYKPSDISSSLSRLKAMMIVAKRQNGSYALTDTVFQRWLAQHQ
jgi:AAA+ ATPase superfamily predicted ATPase